jgi:hypothetical protein
MELTRGLTIINREQAEEVNEEASRRDTPVYTISTSGQSGRDAFFDAVRRALPLDPPVASSRSWDALSDSLWQGIYSLGAHQVVILWPDSSPLKDATPRDFDVALSVLRDVADSLADPAATVGKPVDVCVYVIEPSE